MPSPPGAGRRLLRPALFLAVLSGVVGGAWVLWPGELRHRPAHGPIAVANRGAVAPVERFEGSVRHVRSVAAPELLVPDTVFPDRRARLLWFDGRPAQPLRDGGAVTLDGAGGILRFDSRLEARRQGAATGGREIGSAASAPDGGLWLGGPAGEVLWIDSRGRLVRAAESPFRNPELAADPGGSRLWLVRSPDQFGFGWYPNGAPPALVRIDSSARPADSIGPAVVPEHALLTDLANVGRVAVAGDTLYYAPFIRDQVIAFGPGRDTLWVAERGLPHSTSQPRFELVGGKPVIDYAAVNLGLSLGPDGRLYVLSTTDTTGIQVRLDVLDQTSGRLLRTVMLSTPRPTLAADDEGRVYLLDSFRLLTGVAPREREPLAPFDLERLEGGRLSLADLGGKVVLINFWASWCTPCKAEMPALDSLRRSVTDPAFAFVTIDEDVNVEDARQFVWELHLDVPVLLGHGRMKDVYHYVGLPFTVLVDREGREVERWLGFAGREQIDAIRALVAAELRRREAGS